MLFRSIKYQKSIFLLLISVITLTIIYQIGVIAETYAEVQHETNIVEQQEQEEAFNPTKKITTILEDTEIEIASGEKNKNLGI